MTLVSRPRPFIAARGAATRGGSLERRDDECLGLCATPWFVAS